MTKRLSVVPASDEHAAMLAEFFRVTWDSTASPTEVLAARKASAERNLAEPGRTLPAQVAIQDDRIVGYCGTLAVRFWNGAQEVPGYWAKGLMVLPEFRNGPIGFQLVKDVSKSAPLMGSFTVNPASNKLFGALGYKDHGPLPNLIKPVRLSRIFGTANTSLIGQSGARGALASVGRVLQTTGLPTLIGAVADASLRTILPGAGRSFELGVSSAVNTEEVTVLWQRVRERYPGATVRDGAAILARYGDGNTVPEYRFVTVRISGVLQALAVVRKPRTKGDERLGGIRVASLSDLLVDPHANELVATLLAGSERAALDLNADALLCCATFGPMAALLKRRAFVRVRDNVHFFFKTPVTDTGWPKSVGEWWLARGDSEADMTF